jgi:hypothetical protein
MERGFAEAFPPLKILVILEVRGLGVQESDLEILNKKNSLLQA